QVFPRKRGGYIDPGGLMYQKLAILAAPAAVPPPPPAVAPTSPPPPSPPPTGPIPRLLTPGEKDLLCPIFANTLNYDEQIIARNDGDVGGPDNSYTPGYLPNMAKSLWSWDYSLVHDDAVAAVFVHEMVHVWQSGHGS